MIEPRVDMIDSAVYQRLDPTVPLGRTLVKAHRASKGVAYQDPSLPMFAPRYRETCTWFVAYHYVTGSDPRAQFDNFVSSVERVGGLTAHEVPMVDAEMSATVDRFAVAEQIYDLMVARYGRALFYSAPWVAGFAKWRAAHPDAPLVFPYYGDPARGWALCERLQPVIWQHAGDAGRWPGIRGPVCLDMVIEPEWFGAPPSEEVPMVYPVVSVTRPAALAGLTNGKLPDSVLTAPGFPLRPTARLERAAARAWLALAAACKTATGVTITCTSTADTYRSYPAQVSTFLRRYTPTDYPTWASAPAGKRRRWDDGKGHLYWLLRPGFAPSATPGTSNHGWALAVDTGYVTKDGTIGYLASSAAWSWMLGNAGRFGWSWESQVESWHIRYTAGDRIPQAVLDFEAGAAPHVDVLFDPANGRFGGWPANASKPAIAKGSTGDAVRYLQGVLRITCDGQFGARTDAAVRAFQQWSGVAVDGQVGRRTWAKIDQLAQAREAA